jgi:hypothetical protein
MTTSRHLAIAFAIGGALLLARPAAAEDDRALLSTFCAAADIAGSACKKAKGYPESGNRTCDVKLAKERHRGKFVDGRQLLIVGYESSCEPHASDWGGSVVFERVGDKHLFRSFQPGTQVNDCVALAKDTRQDILVCITGHMGQGFLESGVAQVAFTGDPGKGLETSFDFLLNATDTTGAYGANVVTCKEGQKYFGVSKLAAGPRPMTVTVEVEYADAATIRAACSKKFPKPKEVFGKLSKGEAYVPDGYAKKVRFIIDFTTRKVAPQG